MEITCINCPVGCRMTVEVDNGEIKSVSGNSCPRGLTYAKQECISPLRMVTAVIPVDGSDMPVSVKTRQPIPKASISKCMTALAGLRLKVPVHMGDVVLPDVCDTGIDVIATKTVE